MQRLFDWSARPTERTVTVGSLIAGKGTPSRHAQVTADTEEEASAAQAAGVEMVVCRASNVAAVRRGGPTLFITAALGFSEAITDDEILRTAFTALTSGADAVLTGRRLQVVSLLAAEDIPVMGHLGFVPRKSTWIGKTRAVGKTEAEARALIAKVRRLEDAGAFAVEMELIPATLMTHLTQTSGLVTISLGSGAGGDVSFLFTSDICGESGHLPRHARAFGNIARLRAEIASERLRALTAFRQAVATEDFPAASQIVAIDSEIMASLQKRS